MAITTRAGLVAAIASGRSVPYSKATTTTVAGFAYTLFRTGQVPVGTATIPATTGTTLSRTSVGAMWIPAPSGISYIVGGRISSSNLGTWMLADRLVEFGGLSGIVTTDQAVSALALPSRATSATDVELWLEMYSTAGGTAAPTVTASYTNSAGVAGHVATLVGGIPASGTVINRSYQFTLQAGDTGVKTVESVNLGSTTGSAGNLGLVLRRTLLMFPQVQTAPSLKIGWAETNLQTCPDDACLEIMFNANGTSSGTMQGNLNIVQG